MSHIGFSHFGWRYRAARRTKPVIERLEYRLLLAAHVTSVAADNRGLVTLFFDDDLNPATISDSSVTIFTAGPDGRFNTGDDAAQVTAVNYNAALRAITTAADP